MRIGVLLVVSWSGCGDGSTRAIDASTDATPDAASFCRAELTLDGGHMCAIVPSATREGTSDNFGYHAIGIPDSISPTTPLYIFFRGTGSIPFDPSTSTYTGSSQRLLQEAVDHGRLGLVLAYDNEPAIIDICVDDLACYEAVRTEIIVGIEANEPGNVKHVAPPNDITSRLESLLAYLHTQDDRLPAAIDWATTRIGGASQGGGHAVFIAKQLHDVEWACNLAGLGDVDSNLQPAPWLTSTTWMTPLSRMRSVMHQNDPYYDRNVAAWTAFGFQVDVNWRTLTGATSDPHTYVVADDPEAKAARLWACLEP